MKQLETQPAAFNVTLAPNDAHRLASLRGQFDDNLRLIEGRLNVEIRSRDNFFAVYGDPGPAKHAADTLHNLYRETAHFSVVTPEEVHLHLRQFESTISMDQLAKNTEQVTDLDNFSVIRTKKGSIKPRGLNQQRYVRSIQTHDINFGVGPAGTGKTYLAVACAVEALLRDEVERILLVRPAVEAGERLGFLPGDLAQKVDPYLRPLYDALHEMLGFETVAKLQERNVIEIAPLAYMRGRTLSDSFIIMDEAQNSTPAQIKMLLTRLGENSKAVINGDITQIDLPGGRKSGLVEAQMILSRIPEIKLITMDETDVVRHTLVKKIIKAYEKYEAQKNEK